MESLIIVKFLFYGAFALCALVLVIMAEERRKGK